MKTSFPLDQLFLCTHDVRDFLIVDEDDGKIYLNATKSQNVNVEITGEDGDIDQIKFVEVRDEAD